MSAEHPGQLGANVFFEDDLPVSWQVLLSPPLPREQEQCKEDNELTLRTLHLLQSNLTENLDVAPMGLELRRLEQKIDLLIQWVGTQTLRDAIMPPRSRIRMYQSEFCWDCPQAPAAEQWIEVAVYVEKFLPQALRFRGQVVSPGITKGMTCISLANANGPEYEKFLFRKHRRRVAQAKEKRDAS